MPLLSLCSFLLATMTQPPQYSAYERGTLNTRILCVMCPVAAAHTTATHFPSTHAAESIVQEMAQGRSMAFSLWIFLLGFICIYTLNAGKETHQSQFTVILVPNTDYRLFQTQRNIVLETDFTQIVRMAKSQWSHQPSMDGWKQETVCRLALVRF